ncbi:MAG: hypothetical protein IPH00_16890 [Flavobacteriales bacterium]|nr:hypothetical protein [Flavobacteriales bacterium]
MTKDDLSTTYGTFLSRKEDKGTGTSSAPRALLRNDKPSKSYSSTFNKDKIRQRNSCPGTWWVSEHDHLRIDRRRTHQPRRSIWGRCKWMRMVSWNIACDSAKTTFTHVTRLADSSWDNALEKWSPTLPPIRSKSRWIQSKTPDERAIREVLGKEKSDKSISELTIKGETKKLPDEFSESLVFCDLDLQWNAADEAWQSSVLIVLALCSRNRLPLLERQN